MQFRCRSCLAESQLSGRILNPGTLMMIVGVPAFALAFCALGYFAPVPHGWLQWLGVSLGAALVAHAAVLLTERLIFRFALVGKG